MKEQIHLFSADWMKRNLYKQVKVSFPIYDAAIKAKVKQLLSFQLQDTQKAKRLDKQQNNHPIHASNQIHSRAQILTYEWLKNK